MSTKAMAWAWEQEVPKATAKLTLLCLADCHNSETGACFPSHSHIAKQTGMNIKTVPVAVKYLEEIGLISIQKRAGTRTNYRLKLPQKRGGVQGHDVPTDPQNHPQKRVHPKTVVPPKTGTPKNGDQPPPKTGSDHPQKRGPNLEGTWKEPGSREKHRGISLESVPDELVGAICEFIDHRRNLKKPLTQEALSRFLTTVGRCAAELRIKPVDVISETIDAGWQSVKPDWLRRRLGNDQSETQQPKVPAL